VPAKENTNKLTILGLIKEHRMMVLAVLPK